ncbi:MAG: hypothetical protein BRC29_00485 [Nanohaloarchaea archaeon SW_7_43_1]|nr:MAG: hypothetical protein BRC29_00485 [Nanohaloarchaea archaeon SW_7_43_1]
MTADRINIPPKNNQNGLNNLTFRNNSFFLLNLSKVTCQFPGHNETWRYAIARARIGTEIKR